MNPSRSNHQAPMPPGPWHCPAEYLRWRIVLLLRNDEILPGVYEQDGPRYILDTPRGILSARIVRSGKAHYTVWVCRNGVLTRHTTGHARWTPQRAADAILSLLGQLEHEAIRIPDKELPNGMRQLALGF